MTTLAPEQIVNDLLSSSNSSVEIQQQAGQLLLNLLEPKTPEIRGLTEQEKLELEEKEKAQNLPKNCGLVQLLSVPEEYRQNYPDLFNLISKKTNSQKDKNIMIETNVQKITWNNLITPEDLEAETFEIIAEQKVVENYKLAIYKAKEASDENYNFEELRFPIKLIFKEKIKFEFEHYDCADNVAQYLFVQSEVKE